MRYSTMVQCYWLGLFSQELFDNSIKWQFCRDVIFTVIIIIIIIIVIVFIISFMITVIIIIIKVDFLILDC